MNIKKILLSLCLCILTTFPMKAISLLISDASGEKGDLIEVNLIVKDFDQVASMQFSVNWDSTILSFNSIDSLASQLPQFSPKEIGLVETSSGAIRVAWFDNSLKGVSLSDGTRLFKLQFEIIGEEGITSGVSITNEPISIEFTNSEGVVLEIEELGMGAIVIPDNTTPIIAMDAIAGVKLFQNEPNPFSVSTKIIAVFSKTEPIQLLITDALGKVIYKELIKPIQGENTIEIERAILSTPGTYYYTLQSEQYQLSKKMILLP